MSESSTNKTKVSVNHMQAYFYAVQRSEMYRSGGWWWVKCDGVEEKAADLLDAKAKLRKWREQTTQDILSSEENNRLVYL